MPSVTKRAVAPSRSRFNAIKMVVRPPPHIRKLNIAFIAKIAQIGSGSPCTYSRHRNILGRRKWYAPSAVVHVPATSKPTRQSDSRLIHPPRRWIQIRLQIPPHLDD